MSDEDYARPEADDSWSAYAFQSVFRSDRLQRPHWLGVKCAKEVATAIRGAIILAKISLVPVCRGYWGRIVGASHTVPNRVTGKLLHVGSWPHTGNFFKAIFYALRATYTYLTPDLWEQHAFGPSPYQEHADVLSKTVIKK
ncbi:hypothetical protein PsorP6_014846 [Peronosclerospora sorghi]|uniref:Uncharacterized protein n=1 Tax=Peronosclerospora sorghi TaxID=230839 RepID=A0ACC0VU16_9STRA|nr:hypothetical protein PsorP6_014846 [Peronosclerospora sorghi]